MDKLKLNGFTLIGLKLKKKTTNDNGQSSIDCGSLWQQFEEEKWAEKIPGTLGDEIYTVYYEYESDHTKPFSYFIGCKVKDGIEFPAGMDRLDIPAGDYYKVTAKGQMPDCMINSWKEIWHSDMKRAYQFDFEIYDERSKDWSNAEVEIFLSSK